MREVTFDLPTNSGEVRKVSATNTILERRSMEYGGAIDCLVQLSAQIWRSEFVRMRK